MTSEVILHKMEKGYNKNIGIKPAPGDQEANFKKVLSIPCGLNTMGTIAGIIALFHVSSNIRHLKFLVVQFTCTEQYFT